MNLENPFSGMGWGTVQHLEADAVPKSAVDSDYATLDVGFEFMFSIVMRQKKKLP